jgi:hypothetical protein
MPIRSNLAFRSEFPACSICNEPVEVQTTKFDEIGEPVHEECYSPKVGPENAPPPPSEATEGGARCTDHALPRAIIEFLNSASAQPVKKNCPDCGTDLRNRDCTFFYEGQTWEIPLLICVKCHPTTHVVLPHDA